jgi:transcription antitermination factor NusG
MSASYALRASALKAAAVTTVAATDLPQWFAIKTRYRFEKKVAAQLVQKGCEVYLPLRTEQHLWSDRQKAVTVALFPGYAFVQIDSSREARHRVLQTAGLIGFVSFGGTVIPVPVKQLEDLRLLLLQRQPCSLRPFEQSVQRVRLRGGCLDGLEGVLLRHESGTVLISIEAVQRSIAVETRGYELELI